MNRLESNHELRPPWWIALLESALILMLIGFFAGQLPPDVNESHYLTKAKHGWDAQWCPGDLFLSSDFSHWLFYQCFGWLNALLSLDQVAWTGRWVTWLLFAVAWQRLSSSLVSLKGMSVGSAAIFLLLNSRFHLAGEWVVGGFEAKGIAYGFVVLALAAFVQRQVNQQWIFLGAASAFHVLVGGWAWLAMSLALIMERLTINRPEVNGLVSHADHHPDRSNAPSLLSAAVRSDSNQFSRNLSLWSRIGGTGFLIGILLALIGLIPPLLADQAVNAEEAEIASLIYVNQRIAHHLNFSAFPSMNVARFLVLILALCFLWQRLASNADLSVLRWRHLFRFSLGCLIISFLGLLLSGIAEQNEAYAAWSAKWLRFYWFRLSDFAVPATLALACSIQFQRLLMPFREHASQTKPISTRNVQRILAGLAAIAILAAVVMSIMQTHADPRPPADQAALPNYPENNARTFATYENWKRVCFWIRDNTPADAMVITPASQQTFKWYAQRAEVVSWKDVPQDAASMIQWRQRIAELYEPQRRYETGLMSYSDEQLSELGRKYGATHLIVPQREVDLMTEPTQLKRIYPASPTAKSTYVVFEF